MDLTRSKTVSPFIAYTVTGPAGTLTFTVFRAELTAVPTGQAERTLGAVYGYDCRDALADGGEHELWKALEGHYERAVAVGAWTASR